jgi:hypothetical protein
VNRGKRKGRGCSTPRPREGVGREANPRTPQKVLQEPYGGPLPISSFPFAAHHLVLGVDVGRVDTFAAIDQVLVTALGVDDVVAITAILPILAVATAYRVGALQALHHVVAPLGVDVVGLLGAYELLASVGADDVVFARATPLANTSAAAITASSSVVRLTVCTPFPWPRLNRSAATTFYRRRVVHVAT